jgi:ABC-2 type transport system ATP-binding protein
VRECGVAEPAILVDGLTRDFGQMRAVDHVSLEVPMGSIFGFLGPNGAGKTTTINLLLGLLSPTSGRAAVLGFDTGKHPDEVRAHTGALLDDDGIYEQLTVEENLEFYGRVWRLPPQELRTRMEELLTHLGLWDRRTDRAGTWSRGMKRRLALARALLHRPRVVFLDEPTAGLDVMAANEVREDLAGLASQAGITIFLTTHNMVEAERLCDQIAVIRAGELIAVGDPDALRSKASPQVEVVGRGFTDEAQRRLVSHPGVVGASIEEDRLTIDLAHPMNVAPLVQILVGAGAEIEEVNKPRASLEEAFITLMQEDAP